MQENKRSSKSNRGRVKLLWLHSVLHTPFSPSLLYLPSKHLNVWCVVYFTNRAKKYIYIHTYIYPWYGMVNVDRVIYRWKRSTLCQGLIFDTHVRLHVPFHIRYRSFLDRTSLLCLRFFLFTVTGAKIKKHSLVKKTYSLLFTFY